MALKYALVILGLFACQALSEVPALPTKCNIVESIDQMLKVTDDALKSSVVDNKWQDDLLKIWNDMDCNLKGYTVALLTLDKLTDIAKNVLRLTVREVKSNFDGKADRIRSNVEQQFQLLQEVLQVTKEEVLQKINNVDGNLEEILKEVDAITLKDIVMSGVQFLRRALLGEGMVGDYKSFIAPLKSLALAHIFSKAIKVQ